MGLFDDIGDAIEGAVEGAIGAAPSAAGTAVGAAGGGAIPDVFDTITGGDGDNDGGGGFFADIVEQIGGDDNAGGGGFFADIVEQVSGGGGDNAGGGGFLADIVEQVSGGDDNDGGGGSWFGQVIEDVTTAVPSAADEGSGGGWFGDILETVEDAVPALDLPALDLGGPHVELPDLPSMQSEPVTISIGEELGEGSPIPVVGAPDAFATDPTYIDTPDQEFSVGPVDATLSIDPMNPTSTVHGGTSVTGTDVDLTVDAPGVDVEFDVQIATTVDPTVTVVTPAVGGTTVGGEVTVEVEAPPAEAPDAPADDFQSDLQAIDDAADTFDIFD